MAEPLSLSGTSWPKSQETGFRVTRQSKIDKSLAAVVYYCSSYTDLIEEEYVHILSAFLLVLNPVKMAAHNAHRDIE